MYGLPLWLSGKETSCNAGDAGDSGSIPGSGRSPGEGNGNPLQDSCPEDSVDRGAWWTTICVWVHAMLPQSCPTLCDPVDCSLPRSSVPGILQVRILEWAAVYGVAQSCTQLKQLSSSSSSRGKKVSWYMMSARTASIGFSYQLPHMCCRVHRSIFKPQLHHLSDLE